MAFIAWLFFRHVFAAWIPAADAGQYTAGCIILAAAPCTAMVFVRSYLTDGDPAYTLVQVSVNDLIMLFLFAPIVEGQQFDFIITVCDRAREECPALSTQAERLHCCHTRLHREIPSLWREFDHAVSGMHRDAPRRRR